MGPAIEFENIGLTLGNTEILQNISFQVKAGELHYIIGPNGGGKTSLIRSLLGQSPIAVQSVSIGRIIRLWAMCRNRLILIRRCPLP